MNAEFKKELADLLRKHTAYIVAKSNHENNFDTEIGFQFLRNTGDGNEWTGRHHLGAYDLDGKQ